MILPETHPAADVMDVSRTLLPGFQRLERDDRGIWRAYYLLDLEFVLQDGTGRHVLGPFRRSAFGPGAGKRMPPDNAVGSGPIEVCIRLTGQRGRRPHRPHRPHRPRRAKPPVEPAAA